MKKTGIFTVAVLLLASGAVAGDEVTQSETRVKEHTTHSTTMQGDVTQPGTHQSHGSTVEKQQKTTTSAVDEIGEEITSKRTEVEKESSESSVTDGTESETSGTVQKHQQSETHQHHSTTEVEKK